MTDLRSVLDDQIGELPPSTVDIGAIVARQRRGTMLRRVAAGTAAAGVATALAVAALPGEGAPATVPGARPAPGCSGPAPTTVPPSPWVDPSAAPTAPPETDGGLPVGAEARLTGALRAAAESHLRTVRLRPLGGDREPFVFAGGPCAQARRDSYHAAAMVTSPTGRELGIVSLDVGLSTNTACRIPADGCTVDTRPDGTVVRVRNDRGDLQGVLAVRVIVVIDKPDGTILQLLANGPYDGRPALSAAVLTKIGLDPGLTLDL